MKSYRIVLEYTDATGGMNWHPESWDWFNLLDVGPAESVNVVSVEDIPTPDGHKEELDGVDK
jgi:hypothetical protein